MSTISTSSPNLHDLLWRLASATTLHSSAAGRNTHCTTYRPYELGLIVSYELTADDAFIAKGNRNITLFPEPSCKIPRVSTNSQIHSVLLYAYNNRQWEIVLIVHSGHLAASLLVRHIGHCFGNCCCLCGYGPGSALNQK
jgi:hypothetical protein